MNDDFKQRFARFLADNDETLRRLAGSASPYRPGLEVREYEGEPGNPDHITRSERGMIPIDWVRNMLGARGERPGEHRNRQGQDWEDFKNALTTAGDSGIHAPLFITVDYGKQPQLAEGNHRRDAYVELGAPHVPAEIRYFGHSERQGTVGERAEDAMRHMSAASDIPREQWRQLPKVHRDAVLATDARDDMAPDLAARGHDMEWTHGPNWAQKGYIQSWVGNCRNCGANVKVEPTCSSVSTLGRDARNEACAGPGTAWQNDMIAENRMNKLRPLVDNYLRGLKDADDRAWLRGQGLEVEGAARRNYVLPEDYHPELSEGERQEQYLRDNSAHPDDEDREYDSPDEQFSYTGMDPAWGEHGPHPGYSDEEAIAILKRSGPYFHGSPTPGLTSIDWRNGVANSSTGMSGLRNFFTNDDKNARNNGRYLYQVEPSNWDDIESDPHGGRFGWYDGHPTLAHAAQAAGDGGMVSIQAYHPLNVIGVKDTEQPMGHQASNPGMAFFNPSFVRVAAEPGSLAWLGFKPYEPEPRKPFVHEPRPLDDRDYSIKDVSRHYDWEGFDPYEIEHLVRNPARASFTLEDVSVDSLRHLDQNGSLVRPPSYDEIADQGEDERERLEELERGYQQGSNIPPAVVVRHGPHHIIADGSHRAAIFDKNGDSHMPAFVTERTIFPERHEAMSWSAMERYATGDESDEDFWARQPDVVNGINDSADQAGEAFLEPGDVESDLDDMIPDNTLLREHAHVMRNGFRWNGDLRNPMYEREHWRDIVDSEGRPTHDQEGHVIERNTRVLSPQLDEDADPRSFPWMHTYHPAGVGDEEGLVSGHNTAQGATRAAIQLGLYGTHHPRSQELLKGYRYLGSGEPYDPSVELPHDAAQRMRG